MAAKTNSGRINFSKIQDVFEMPNLLDLQVKFYNDFLQLDVESSERRSRGLQAVFNNIFPIVDTRENFILEFIEYFIDPPKYSVRECQERGVTYSVLLKAKLRLSSREDTDEEGTFSRTIEQDVYLGNLPYMTERGTFIINGAERVIVSQIHRSPGVFFDEEMHPNGTKMYIARIIPFRGSWVEFTTDINDVMYVYIDRRKKFPVTTLLRALGYSSDAEVFRIFNLTDVVQLDESNGKLDKYYGRKLVNDVVNTETGELIADKYVELSKEVEDKLFTHGVKEIELLKSGRTSHSNIIANTVKKDSSKSEKDALEIIYRQLRSGEAPDMDTARNLIERLFFNPKKYDLGRVGRHRINKKLKLKLDPAIHTLTHEDIISIIKYLMSLKSEKRSTDDIDHLGNRRVRTVGEQLATQFSVGLARMARTIKERMNLRDSETLTPQDLVNARTISSVINTFFGTSQLSQFMDQTNPLAELTHKRRLSALGPSGLTRERAGFEVRDVHYTHYGRLCPIETPEGPNIGLISSMSTYAKVNEYGFIETPYRKVIDGKVTNEIEYLTADDEDNFIIAQANAPIDEDGKFLKEWVKARHGQDFPVVKPEQLEYMDVSPKQLLSAAANLIPFIEHDDANRALMGSNMQRQAVPLLLPESPIVGTGMESKVAKDSKTIVVSHINGEVVEVDAQKIILKKDYPDIEEAGLLVEFGEEEYVTYELIKYSRTNQDTTINMRPIVKIGDKIKEGDVLADGCGTSHGELALGKNIVVAFMPWKGYNFEDAIIISERLVRDDTYTSIHVEEFELQVRDTKRGEEELTREIPNVSEEATKNLDKNGIVRVGAEVVADDIIVGKVTPKGETDPTPEEKLLKAIFGEKAGDVKDASLKAPPGMKGIVIDTKLFSRKIKSAAAKKEEKKYIENLEKDLKNNLEKIYGKLKEFLKDLMVGKKVVELVDIDGNTIANKGTKIDEKLFKQLKFDIVDLALNVTDDDETNKKINKIYSIYKSKKYYFEEEFKKEKFKVTVGDELPPGIVQLSKVYIAKKRKLAVGDKMAGRHGNKGVVSKIVPIEDMPFLIDGTPVDIILNPLGVPSRMNLGQIMETTLGWAGKILSLNFASPVFDGASIEEVEKYLNDAGLNISGKVKLYDGTTGELFDDEISVGIIYMMKLSHLVDDKIHARSIGPYSLITQQPLGGKAQFGGQRFGEMEVWALEAYGAAHTLQEILTVKSDDVNGRSRVYEAIVKGENLPEPGIPESFNVLVREFQGLGLDVKIE